MVGRGKGPPPQKKKQRTRITLGPLGTQNRSKKPFTHAILSRSPMEPLLQVYTSGDFCAKNRRRVASSFQHVRNHCDITATNRTENALKSPLVYTFDFYRELERDKMKVA